MGFVKHHLNSLDDTMSTRLQGDDIKPLASMYGIFTYMDGWFLW